MRFIDLRTETEIRELDAAVKGEENIIRLYIPVNHILRMQELQAVQRLQRIRSYHLELHKRETHLSTHRSNLPFTHNIKCHHIG